MSFWYHSRLFYRLQEKPLCDQKFGSNGGFDGNLRNKTHLLENAKIVLRLLPIWAMLLMFAVIFQQPATFFTKQGMTMKRNIGRNFKIPPATLQSAITLSIILMMPLYDKVLIPITQIVTRNQKGITVMQRMGVGMFLSIIAMIIAAVVETKRLEISKKMSSLLGCERWGLHCTQVFSGSEVSWVPWWFQSSKPSQVQEEDKAGSLMTWGKTDSTNTTGF